MESQSRSTRDRHVRWPFLLALLLVAVSVPFVLAVPQAAEADIAGPPPVWPDDAAARVLSALPAPAGTTRDWYGTACGMPTEYCITDAHRAVTQLFADAVALLSRHGVSMDWTTCWPDRTSPLFAECYVEAHDGGLHLAVEADDRALRLGGDQVMPWLGLSVEGAQNPDQYARLLPAWSELKLIPPGWSGQMTCTSRPVGGCGMFQGDFTVRSASPSAVAASWRTWLADAGYRVELRHCQAAERAAPERCLMSATRFLGLGGRDQIVTLAVLRPAAPGSVLVTLGIS